MIKGHNFIIQTVPKCGTHWLMQAMKDLKDEVPSSGHGFKTHAYVGKNVGIVPDHEGDGQQTADVKHILCIIRDPADWYRSWFGMRYLASATKPWVFDRFFNEFGNKGVDVTLDNFIEWTTDKYPGSVTRLFYQYMKNATQIGSLENITDELIVFLDHAGYQVDRDVLDRIGPLNQERKKVPPLDSALRDTVYAVEEQALDWHQQVSGSFQHEKAM